MIKNKILLLGTIIFLAAFSNAATMPTANNKEIALRPQQNEYRNSRSLSGLWNFKVDKESIGEAEQWYKGLTGGQPIAVPGSWNDQIEELHNYLGTVWYETEVIVPHSWASERIFLRIGSANYAAKVWINGKPLGMHEGGHLPFAFELSSHIQWGEANRITIQMENELRADRVPLGNVKAAMRNFPATNYDFFPYGGLHCDVVLYTAPKTGRLTDVTISTALDGTVALKIEKQGKASGGKVTIKDATGKRFTKSFSFTDDVAHTTIQLPDVKLWSPENPYLYTTTVELTGNNKTVDAYSCQTGVRTVAVSDQGQLLLNGKPIKLRGFGNHEGFPVFGRGFAQPVAVKDFQLMRWAGANSFRTSHYPYDESVYDIADQLGFLVIDEIPAVGLQFYDEQENIDKRRAACDQYLEEMILRDKNHPSVIIWCVANEPYYQGMGGANYNGKEQQGNDRENEQAIACLGGLIDQAKAMDPTRLATFVGVSGGPASWLGVCDLICINRYYGWYTNPGDLEGAIDILDKELDRLHTLYGKPIMLTEFGADAIAGEHSEYAAMFSEEFQCKFIKSYLDLANTKPYITGMHIWNLADFTTGQAMFRVAAKNFKGVFTQDRKPKMAAHMLHKRWTEDKNNY